MDQRELEHRIYTQKSEADKAINSLVGILQGIGIDGVINEKERKELIAWASIHTSMINRKNFSEFMIAIHELLNNDQVDKVDLLQDINWLCQQYGPENYYYKVITTELQSLQGVLHGLLADGVLHDDEIIGLNKWIDENEHLANYYPYDEIRSLLLNVLSDGVIEEHERLELMAFFNQFVNIQDPNISSEIQESVKDIRISGHCSSDPQISFEGKKFCITGVLIRGTRKQLQKSIIDNGGIIATDVVKDLDYLIVGHNGNPAWAFACYGRKVEKAIDLRKQGHPIQIIHEYSMFDHIDDL